MAKKQWEVDAKNRFLSYLLEHHGQEYTQIDEDVVVNPLTGRNYDYELTPTDHTLPVIALEIFRIVGEEEELKGHSTWIDITQRLRTALETRGVIGYHIRTPHFQVPKCRRDEFVSNTADMLAAAIANSPNAGELTVENYVLYKHPDDPGVRFSHIGGARLISPFGSVRDTLIDLLPTKNEQLDVPGRLRVLLIASSGILREDLAIREYFSTHDASEFPNVDMVFSETGVGNFSLVFDRKAFDCYREEKIPEDEESATLFFTIVEHRLLTDRKKALHMVTKMHDKYGALDRLSVGGRDALISCGENLVEEGDWPSVLWIIERLENDPDPPFPNSAHARLAEGNRYGIITSIRGRLCWLIQKVIVHNQVERYDSMLKILERYATGPDFYIRSQACVPLCELARRRQQRLPGGERFMPDDLARRVRDVAFQILTDAASNPALLEEASHVLHWIIDLTEKEAAYVLDQLSPVRETNAVHNRCGLLLYFALHRESPTTGSPSFDSQLFKARLHYELRAGDSKFRASLMWQMAGGAEGGTFPYELIGPYLESFLSGPYDEAGSLHLRRIWEAHVREHSANIGPLILRALEKLADFIASEPRSRGWSVYEMWDYFDLLAEHCSEDCALDGLALMLSYKPKIPCLSGTGLAAALDRFQSARAQQLRSQYSQELNT